MQITNHSIIYISIIIILMNYDNKFFLNLQYFYSIIVNCSAFLLMLNTFIVSLLGVYDARTRVLILHIANYLDVPVQLVELFEESVIEMLSGEIPPETEQDALEKAKRQKMRKIKRYCMIGLAGMFTNDC